MQLLCPIKSGIFRNWSKNVQLKNLDEFYKCQTQGFGGNYEIYKKFGIKGHNGLDIQYENGTEVFASHDGVVAFAGHDSSAGKGITLDGDCVRTIYWHLQEFLVKHGDKIKAGQLIAKGDSTGFSTGPHLHYGLKLMDSKGNVLNRDNGYDGAVDPTPFIVWHDADQYLTEKEVEQLQALEGYKDEGGIEYWTGKPLSAYLAARVVDKINTLQNTL